MEPAAALRRTLVPILVPLALAAPARAGAGRAPVVVSLTAAPASQYACQHSAAGYVCPASGAAIVLTARVRGATTCTFSSQRAVFSSLYPVRTVGCAGGSATVTVPPVANASRAPATIAYAVRARGSGGTSERRVTIMEAPSSVPAPTPAPAPSPAPPPTPPPAPSAPQPAAATSTNWSGYWIGGGPFTGASASFDVPNLYATPGETDVSEWVGIDGVDDDSLIQAGVDEHFDPATGLVRVSPWWEILPALSVPILMRVAPGDEITVVIGQVSGTLWLISLTDDTTGRRFAIEQTYYGPATSAEWIVEAPTSPLTGSTYALGDYSSVVTFGDPRYGGTATSITEVVMVQDGVPVSTPSPVDANGFSVAYGPVAPPPP